MSHSKRKRRPTILSHHMDRHRPTDRPTDIQPTSLKKPPLHAKRLCSGRIGGRVASLARAVKKWRVRHSSWRRELSKKLPTKRVPLPSRGERGGVSFHGLLVPKGAALFAPYPPPRLPSPFPQLQNSCSPGSVL